MHNECLTKNHMGANCKYSIITPVYNRGDCIVRCMESVTRNLASGTSVEHIIVDDGSTDDTVSLVEKYAAIHSHVNFVRFEKNRGTNAARNAAIAVAKGEFCIILDSDDYFADCAIKVIDSTIKINPGFGHYLFVPNDRVGYVAQNLLLKDKKSRILFYVDFLNNSVTGDFIHVIKIATLRKYPFIEHLRIYEGIFFLQFYKEAHKVLFTNEVVAIRERSRSDSVTRAAFRNSNGAIMRHVYATSKWIEWFAVDCKKLGLLRTLFSTRKQLLENFLLLSDYKSAKTQMDEIMRLGFKVPLLQRLVYRMRCGMLFRNALTCYLTVKYKILKVRLR